MSVNNEHKDRLFKMIFGRPEHREWTLSLYNAVNGTDYDDPSEIRFNTMEDTLYMGMKNDVSFVMDMWLNLYGHQSTYNPNMPLRCLIYLGRLWSKELVEGGNVRIYGNRLVEIPVPKFVVFYNGTTAEPDEMELKLSTSFPEDKRDQADIELKVRMININHGHSGEIAEKCRPLYEYSWFIDKIREYNTEGDLEKATDRALTEMPEDFGIKKYLIANKEEVRMGLLTEYDEQKLMDFFKEEGREEGREEERRNIISDMLRRGKTPQAIAEFCDYPLELIEEVKKSILVSD